MTAPKSVNPATGSVNGVRESEQLGGELEFQATTSKQLFQASAVGVLEFSLNAREIMRAEVGEFGGRKIVNIRRWFRADDGSMRPTPKGVACALHHLPALAELVNGVLARARADGLLPEKKRGLA